MKINKTHFRFSLSIATFVFIFNSSLKCIKEEYFNGNILFGAGSIIFIITMATLILYAFIYMYEKIFKRKFIIFKDKKRDNQF